MRSTEVHLMGMAKPVKAWRRSTGYWLLATGFFLLFGCAKDGGPTTQPSSSYERGEQALKDPFGYSPGFGKSDTGGSRRESGGGTGRNRKGIGEWDGEGLRKDLEHVFNP